jgi:RND family efflux transporter MFP subunit
MPTRSLIFLFALALAGCNKAATTPTAPAKPIEVMVEHPSIKKSITDTVEFPGRLEPFDSIVVRSRVTGYLENFNFEDGADVKKGKLLFEIDPLPYVAEFERAKAAVTQAVAKRDRLKKDFDRMSSASAGAVSKEELDRVTGDLAEAEAAVQVATANRKLAETNLDYTKITAKTAGRISRRMVDPGNLVKADETVLTTIVALDPVYASFDIDERTLLELGLSRDNLIMSYRSKKIQVGVALADEKGFYWPGGRQLYRPADIKFVDNQVNSRTGTIRLRALLPNPKFILSPGLYVRILFPVRELKDAVLIPEEAIGSDQGQKFVFVITGAKKMPNTDAKGRILGEGEVRYRKVEMGPAYGSLRVIKDGVKDKEIVVVRGMQRLKDGTKVQFPWPAKPIEKPASYPPTKSVTATVSGGSE